MFWRLWVILGAKKTWEQFSSGIESRRSKSIQGQDKEIVLELVKDDAKKVVHELEVGLSFVRIIASVAPLLGLLGTVLGILDAFHTGGNVATQPTLPE